MYYFPKEPKTKKSRKMAVLSNFPLVKTKMMTIFAFLEF